MMTVRKFAAFGIVSIGLSVGLVVGLVIAGDLYLHHRFGRVAGYNYRGYRGPVAHRKRPEEQRIVVLGGSTAFGYGVAPDESFPWQLERRLDPIWRGVAGGSVNVVNLAYNNQGAYSFRPTLEDYAYLNYDVAVLYEGYNDLGGHNVDTFRRHSPIFRLTGYMPIFPLIFREKAMVLLAKSGSLERAYRGLKTTFRPDIATRAPADAPQTAADTRAALQRQLEEFAGGRDVEASMADAPGYAQACGVWAFYCQHMDAAVTYAVDHGKRVVVVTQPYLDASHRDQQAALVRMLAGRYGAEPRVRYVNLGEGAVDLKDPAVCYDGMHLTAAGNAQLADHLVEPLLEVLADRRVSARRITVAAAHAP